MHWPAPLVMSYLNSRLLSKFTNTPIPQFSSRRYAMLCDFDIKDNMQPISLTFVSLPHEDYCLWQRQPDPTYRKALTYYMADNHQACCKCRDGSQDPVSPLLCLGPISLLQCATDGGSTTAVSISKIRARSILVRTDDGRHACVPTGSIERQGYGISGARSTSREQVSQAFRHYI